MLIPNMIIKIIQKLKIDILFTFLKLNFEVEDSVPYGRRERQTCFFPQALPKSLLGQLCTKYNNTNNRGHTYYGICSNSRTASPRWGRTTIRKYKLTVTSICSNTRPPSPAAKGMH